MLEKIEINNQLLALILYGDDKAKGVKFFTESSNSFQIGLLQHSSGSYIKPHIHRTIHRAIDDTQEVLHIEEGMVEVEFFDHSEQIVSKRVLNPGDTVLLVSGGHGFNILRDSRIIEIKQGPYGGIEEDKVHFAVAGVL
jgi:hypothetical protein